MNTRSFLLIMWTSLILLTAAGCLGVRTDIPLPDGIPNMSNPASSNCVEKGFTSEIRTSPDGSQYAICIFSDGTACEEWAFLRGECLPGQLSPDDIHPPANPTGSDVPDFEAQLGIAAREILAEKLGIEPSSILFAGLEEAVWPDACLGLPSQGEMCAQVEIRGYLITLSVGGSRYLFRSDQTGSQLRMEVD